MTTRARNRHIVFVQWGDYREAVQHLALGGAETHAAQRQSVDFVAHLTKQTNVSVLCLSSDTHDELLANGVRTVGVRYSSKAFSLHLLQKLELLAPTDLIVSSPILSALSWAFSRGRRVLPSFADTFSEGLPTERLKQHMLVSLLNRKEIPFVASHKLGASCELTNLGISPDKILPWDWPAAHSPYERAPKKAPLALSAERPLRLFFMGKLDTRHGLPDLIWALRALKDAGIPVCASVAGQGELDCMRALAAQEGVADAIVFLGRLADREAVPLMRAHDLVVVPSRHTAEEDLPDAIYDGLCSRTPLVLSSHRVFARVHQSNRGAAVFEAGNAAALARCVQELLADPSEYERLSSASAATWDGIQIGLKWSELITRWLGDSPSDQAFLRSHSLSHHAANRALIPAHRQRPENEPASSRSPTDA